jgi:hypothetical protein
METLCDCAFPQAVNKADERYHCDKCGYPLAADDRRHAILRHVSPEIWMILAYRAHGYRSPVRAWDMIEREVASHINWPPPPREPPLTQIRFRTLRFMGFDFVARE